LQLLKLDEKLKRAKNNLHQIASFVPGAQCSAYYNDPTAPPAVSSISALLHAVPFPLMVFCMQWYDAVLGEKKHGNRFIVTFPEYGNTEEVSLGEIILDSSPSFDDRGGNRGGGGNSRSDHDRSIDGRERSRDR
jgi:hypothetical protein